MHQESSDNPDDTTETVDDLNYLENEIDDDDKSEKEEIYNYKDDCSMQEYEIMKVYDKKEITSVLLTATFFRIIYYCTTMPDSCPKTITAKITWSPLCFHIMTEITMEI